MSMAGRMIRRMLARVRRPLSRGLEPALSAWRRRAVEVTAASREAEARLRTIFEHAPIGMVMLDAEGRPVELNAALRAMLKGDERELRRMRFSDVVRCETESLDSTFDALIQGRTDHFSGDVRMLRRDGTEFHGRTTVANQDTVGRLKSRAFIFAQSFLLLLMEFARPAESVSR